MGAMHGPNISDGEGPTLVLASASPRRKEILERAWSGRLEVLPSGIDEGEPMVGESVADYAMRLAAAKARDVSAAVAIPALVVAADTVVGLDGRPLGKPTDPGDARAMLEALRGRSHEVTTGLALATTGGPEVEAVTETSIVHMRNYSDAEIADYVASGDPFDKAGGYAVQSTDFAPADRVSGCYLNVVGLPLCRLRDLLSRARPGAAVPGIAGPEIGGWLDLGGSCQSCESSLSVREGVAAR